jgi:PAS domain S-box-containing protein
MSDVLPSETGAAPVKKDHLGRYWRDILANIPDAVTVYDKNGDVVYANELASRDLRYSTVDMLMKQNLTDIAGRYIIHDAHEHLLGVDDLPTRRAFRDKVVAEDTLHFSAVDGSENFWLVAKAFPIVGGRSGFKYVVSTYHEITSFKEAEAQLRDSNRRMLTLLDDLMKME